MTNNNIADLQNMDLGKTLIDEDLSKYTTYKVGGKDTSVKFNIRKDPFFIIEVICHQQLCRIPLCGLLIEFIQQFYPTTLLELST